MCGIFALLNNEGISVDKIQTQFFKGKNRGPDNSTLVTTYPNLILGFHRLSINGLNIQANQPLIVDDIVLICNGEIYNYKELYKSMNITPNTESDCEVIIHLFIKYGIDQTLQMLDGVFSFILYDNRSNEYGNQRLYVARDSHGVRPLYYLRNLRNGYMNDNLSGFASELKCLDYFIMYNPHQYKIEQFKPGTYSVFESSRALKYVWLNIIDNKIFYNHPFSYNLLNYTDSLKYKTDVLQNISYHLNTSVNKQCGATDRPIACLLSGGLDSSIITALVNDFCKKNNCKRKLETYSIGLHGSEDLKYARIVANYLDTNHTEIIVTEEEMFRSIPDVIYAIESQDTTTVRASIGNYLLGKYISANSSAKVIFNGDGADELCGGYLYMNNCPDEIEFDKETRRLLSDIHMFDVLRSDKCISCHGLEPRPPFLDRDFTNFYLTIPTKVRRHKECEKFLLRKSFTFPNFENFEGKQLLPDQILWRKKEAFSDGVSNQGRSLFKILQERIVEHFKDHTGFTYSPNIITEKMYYKQIFNKYFPNSIDILPYFWMPRYTNATDPSARTLDIYTIPEFQAENIER